MVRSCEMGGLGKMGIGGHRVKTSSQCVWFKEIYCLFLKKIKAL